MKCCGDSGSDCFESGLRALFFRRYQQLEEASASLRERIRHLDDMVHCQQKKVKQMVEEVSSEEVWGPGQLTVVGKDTTLAHT